MILYLDRAAISSAKTSVATALSLSDAAMGAVFSAFALGYAFAQIPSGWLADRFGPRVTLAFVVALWSVFTMLTGVNHTVAAEYDTPQACEAAAQTHQKVLLGNDIRAVYSCSPKAGSR